LGKSGNDEKYLWLSLSSEILNIIKKPAMDKFSVKVLIYLCELTIIREREFQKKVIKMDDSKSIKIWRNVIIVILSIVMISNLTTLTGNEIITNNMEMETDVHPSNDFEINDYIGMKTRNTRGDEDEWSGIWTTKSTMSLNRHGIGAAVVNNKIYVLGGYNLDINEEYDPVTDTWTTKSPMPHPHAYPGVAVVKNKIYVIGGSEGGGSAYAIDVYDPFTDNWTTKKPMPSKREYFGVGAVADKIYLIGGDTFSNNTNESVMEYDPITETWTEKAPLPFIREGLGVIALDNKIYAIGGRDSGWQDKNETQVYDPVNDTWTIKRSMIKENSWFGIGALNNKIHIVGGRASAGETHYVYDPITDTWVESISMPTGRDTLAVGVINNSLFAIGGRIGGLTKQDVNEAFYFGDANHDLDNDGLTNLQEISHGTQIDNMDSDGDNLGDGFEVIFSKTDPNDWDTNANSIGDGLEFIQKKGYLGWIESLPDKWIGMTITWDSYTIFVKTNSSVLEGEKEELELKIKVSGPEGTLGVTEIEVPKGLCDPEDIEIVLDGDQINYTLTEDETYYYIYIEYDHSVHELSASFDSVIDYSDHPTDEEEGSLDIIYIMSLIIALIVILLLSVVIIRNKGKSDDIGVQELPPDKLSMLLDKKHEEGKISDKTYDDAKSLLEKFISE
jgi:N-acetylneuraminic acid mutarotase